MLYPFGHGTRRKLGRGLRGNLMHEQLLSVTTRLLRNAYIKRKPVWMDAVYLNPPKAVPPSKKGKIPNLTFTTDRLLAIYERNNFSVVDKPRKYGIPWKHNRDESLKFVRKQWALMKKGVPEHTAYKKAEELMRLEALGLAGRVQQTINKVVAEGASSVSMPAAEFEGLVRDSEQYSMQEEFDMARRQQMATLLEELNLGLGNTTMK